VRGLPAQPIRHLAIEALTSAKLVADTETVDIGDCSHHVLLKLEQTGLIKA
jgi:hypothetical protein